MSASAAVTSRASAERAASPPRLFAATYFGPGWTSGGAVIVDALLRDYPADRVLRYSVPLRAGGSKRVANQGLDAPDVRGLNHARLAPLSSRALWYVGSRAQARRAATAAREFSADVVWSVLDYLWLPFTYRLMRATDLPVHVSVHDDPVESARLAGWPKDILRRLDAAFAFCYRNATSRDVISEGMRARYAAAYDRDAIVVTHGIPSGVAATTSAGRVRARPLRVVHAGNLLYPGEAIAFIEAVHRPGEIELTFIGNIPQTVKDVAARRGVEIVSWLPQHELDARLRAFDFAYLPYGFAEDRRLFVETSFPTKLVTYVKAGLPVIHHGPAYSSVARFMRSFGLGMVIDQPAAGRAPHALRAVTDAAYAKMRSECARAANEALSQHAITARWLEVLGESARQPNRERRPRA